MNIRRITARTAIAGATTALAAGALVGISTTAANAESASSTYTCSAPADAYVSDFAITVEGGLPVPAFWAGAPVPPGLVSIDVTSTLTPEQAAALGGFGITGAHSDDFTLGFGPTTVPLPVDGDFDSSSGSTVWTASGSNKAFTTPDPGAHDIVLPASFTMTTENSSGDFLPLACVVQADTTPSVLVSGYPLNQQLSQTTAKAKSGTKPTIAVAVQSTSWGQTVATGKVVVKEGKKVVGKGTLKKGKAVVTLVKSLKVGKHKVTVSYAGTKSLKGSSTKATVTKKK
jgi:hypothetical protein